MTSLRPSRVCTATTSPPGASATCGSSPSCRLSGASGGGSAAAGSSAGRSSAWRISSGIDQARATYGAHAAHGTPSASTASAERRLAGRRDDPHRADTGDRRARVEPLEHEVGLGRRREHQAHRRQGAAAAGAARLGEHRAHHAPRAGVVGQDRRGSERLRAHQSSSEWFHPGASPVARDQEGVGLGAGAITRAPLDPAHLRAVARPSTRAATGARRVGRPERHQGAVGRERDRSRPGDRRGPGGERLGAPHLPDADRAVGVAGGDARHARAAAASSTTGDPRPGARRPGGPTRAPAAATSDPSAA